MFVGSLTLSSILITFGFQTASAIVMAVAGGTLPIKFYSCDRGKLTWAKRDSYFPDCTLLSSTHRVFHVDGENIIHIGMPEGGNQDSGVGDNQNSAPGQLMYRPWDSMADLQALHLLKKDIQDSRGWVFFLPPDTHGEAGRIIETLDAIPAGINDIEMVGRETENPGYENQVPDEMLQISDDNSVWVHIKYTAIDNELGGPGSTDVEAIVGDKKAFFYSGPGGELKLLQKKSRGKIRFDKGSPIIPLKTTNCLFFLNGPADQIFRDVYQSPIRGDPSLNDQRTDLFVNKRDFNRESKATVMEITGSHRTGVRKDWFLPVKFVNKKISSKSCCVTQPDVQND